MKNAGTTDDMASSVEWFFLWVYWCGSTVTSMSFIRAITSCLKHFVTMRVEATIF